MKVKDSRGPSRTLEVEEDVPHVSGKVLPQQQEMRALVPGKSGEEIEGQGVVRRVWSTPQRGGAGSGVGLEGDVVV